MSNLNLDDLPHAQIKESRWPSPVWLIPIVAALIGGWLLYQHWYLQGALLRVEFSSAEGVVERQTVVRYKHVVVGRVEEVKLEAAESATNLVPVVYMRLNREMDALLNCNAQFWVVRPRIKGAEITGLGTLFSGTYINMLPRPASAQAETSLLDSFSTARNCYQALDEAPVVQPTEAGRSFKLESDSLGSVGIGSPVFYKKLEVGEVVNYRIKRDSSKVELDIFIKDPYYEFVSDNSRFWNASGIEFEFGTSGAAMRMESLSSLLIGGIAFDTPQTSEGRTVSAENTRFTLFKDYKTSRQKYYAENERLHYIMYFSGSVRGLKVGAPVEYQGIPVGHVDNIAMNMNPDTLKVSIPVLVYIDPKRFSPTITTEQAKAMMQSLVEQGVRAKLSSGNLLTGDMYIALAKDDDAKPAEIENQQFASIFPTNPDTVEEITRIASNLADEVQGTLKSIRTFVEGKHLESAVKNASTALKDVSSLMRQSEKTVKELRSMLRVVEKNTLPRLTQDFHSIAGSVDKAATAFQSTSGTANRTMTELSGSVKRITGTANRTMTDLSGSVKQITGTAGKLGHDVTRVSNDLVKTMRRLQNSLGHFDRLAARNSPTQYQLMEMMEEVTAASRAVRELSEHLQRQPDALIRGRR